MSKIDEAKLNAAMKIISDHFQTVAAISMGAHNQLAKLFTPPVPSHEVVNDVPNFFPDPYADMMQIEFDAEANVYRAYPVKFLGTDNFKAIADIVQKLGGTYVKGDKAAGVKAHFTIPKEKA
jgi:hypothetical protein